MQPHASNAGLPMAARVLRFTAVSACLIVLLQVVLSSRQHAHENRTKTTMERAFSSYTAELVALQAEGAPFPKGKAAKEGMWRAFKRDVARGLPANAAIPPRLPSGQPGAVSLRVMAYNIHFWQRGYSAVVMGPIGDGCRRTTYFLMCSSGNWRRPSCTRSRRPRRPRALSKPTKTLIPLG